MGKLAFFRVYSGMVKAGSYILNSSTGGKERVGRIVRLHANIREEVSGSVGRGDRGHGGTQRNVYRSHAGVIPDHPILLESISFPEPVISIAIEPKTKADQEKMGVALNKLAEEDPTFRVRTDEETNQVIISGMGELHLDIIVDRMKREFSVECNVGQPQVSYRETIKGNADGEGKFIRQSGGRGQYGHALIHLEKLNPGEGVQFEEIVKGGSVPKEYFNPIEKGIREATERGVLAGYPILDVKAVLYDGSYHEVDSSEAAFKIAGSMAFQDAAKKAGIDLLEPIMKVEVVTPEDFMGTVVGDLNAKRGQIQNMADRSGAKVIDALVPLAEMFGYATLCDPSRKVARVTPWSSRITMSCLATSRRRLSKSGEEALKRSINQERKRPSLGSVFDFCDKIHRLWKKSLPSCVCRLPYYQLMISGKSARRKS